MMIDAHGFRKLTTALYPEGDLYLTSDPVFGVKKSLVVVSRPRLLSDLLIVDDIIDDLINKKLVEIDDETEARKRGFQTGTKFKLLSYDFTLLSNAEAAAAGSVERAK